MRTVNHRSVGPDAGDGRGSRHKSWTPRRRVGGILRSPTPGRTGSSAESGRMGRENDVAPDGAQWGAGSPDGQLLWRRSL